jgi:hypothetical protein
LRRRRGEPMDLEQHGADRNHKNGKIDEKLHCPARVTNGAQTKRRPYRTVPGFPHTEPWKFNLQYLFCTNPPGPAGRLISAVGRTKRTVSGGASIHVATHFRFGRSRWRRCLRGSASRCRPCGRGTCRRCKCLWNYRGANRRRRN